jgi:GTPase SAR1 family protein
MYDVSSPKSLHSLRKWWDEFKQRAPVREGEEDFCCVVVGNKVDVLEIVLQRRQVEASLLKVQVGLLVRTGLGTDMGMETERCLQRQRRKEDGKSARRRFRSLRS